MWEVWKDRPDYPHFKVGMPFDLPEGKKTIAPLTKNQVFVAGYAVRPAFLEAPMTKERLEVERLKRKVASDAVVALIMCGSEGYDMPWPKQLADSETWNGRPLHVFVVVGSNDEFGKLLETSLSAQEQADGHLLLKGSNKLVTLEVVKESANTIVNSKTAYFVPETELVVLMDLADVLLTKAGGSTTAEAAYRGLPVLFDDTDGMLRWEAFNAHLVKDHHRGKLLVDPNELESDLLSVAKLGKSLSLVTHHKTGQIVNTTALVRDEIFSMQAHRAKERRKLLTSEVFMSTSGALATF
jgi:UDP-N-acetylglucosamine:LPS N-acetylglucosamine transferase